MSEYGEYKGQSKLTSLNMLLNGVYLPLIQAKDRVDQQKWHDGNNRQKTNETTSDTLGNVSISYDFMNNLKKFSQYTNQTLRQIKSKVSLEIPDVDISDPKEASKDEQIVSRIESKLEYWTQLIRSLLETTNAKTREGDGPLSEIEFWRSRTASLGTFWEQLNDEKVKEMINVLRYYENAQMLAGYEDQFQELTKMYTEAKDNVKFLETLERHFKNIARTQDSLLSISDTLPSMMRALRMVWIISRHYNTDKQMVPLMELIGNEIALKVTQYVNFEKAVEEVFDNPEKIRQRFVEARTTVRKWRTTYEQVASEMSDSDNPWDFDPERLFEKTDYIYKRCTDFILIIDTIVKYKSFLGPEMEAGTGDKRGVEQVLKDVENLLIPFKKFPSIFDKSGQNRWSSIQSEFQNSVSEVDLLISEFIDNSFSKIRSAEGAFKLLQDVKRIQAKDDASFEQKMHVTSQQILENFGTEVDQIKHIFDIEKNNPPKTKNLPPTAGSIYWSNSLFERIRTPLLSINTDILDSNEKGLQIKEKCVLVSTSIKDFEKKHFDNWKNTVSSAALSYLKNNILGGNLSQEKGYVNFHPDLTLLIQETKYLDKLNKQVPELAQNVTLQEDKYHSYVENLKLMLDNFNNSIKMLEKSEKRILRPQIEKLKKTLRPGFKVLNWTSLGIDDFIKRCNGQINNFQAIVNKIKRNTSIIRGFVNSIQSTCLIMNPADLKDRSLDLQQLYSILSKHKDEQLAVVKEKYLTISQTLLKIEGDLISYKVIDDPEKTKVTGREPLLASYYEYWEKAVYKALRKMVLSSINRLSSFRRTPGIIRVTASLVHAEIVVTPDGDEINKMMSKITVSLIESTKCCIRWMKGTCIEVSKIKVKRDDIKDDERTLIEEHFSHYTWIHNSNELNRAKLHVVTGTARTLAKMAKLLASYEKFNSYWKFPREAAIQRFGDRKPAWEAYDDRLEDCQKLIQDIQLRSKPRKDIHFIRIDMQPLLTSIQESARKWIVGFGELLNSKVKPKLENLVKEIKGYREKLDEDVTTINELRAVLGVIDTIRNRNVDMESEYLELESCYNTLQIYEINVPAEEYSQCHRLASMWNELVEFSKEKNLSLENSKKKFAEDTKKNVALFKTQIQSLEKRFIEGPKNNQTSLEDGLKQMGELRQELVTVQQERDYLVRSEKLFELPITSYPDLVQLEKDMVQLGQIYDLYKEWITLVEKWSKTLFDQIPIEAMKKQAKIFLQRLRKEFSPEAEATHTHKISREAISAFKKSIPLFEKLKSDALRDRHWEQLMKDTGVRFDPKAATLQNLIDMKLYKYEEQIADIFSDAKKELKIEQLLNEVAESWRNRKFQLKKHIRDGEDRGYILIGRDTIKEALEEDTTSLAGISGSRHVIPFMGELTQWEKALSQIDEVVDLWWDVQNTWINLEVIFVGSQDIREQLQKYSKDFDKIDNDWAKLMQDTSKNRTIKEATHVKGRDDVLKGLQQRLASCQKGLATYLQTKRDAFSRFYYISDEELLQLLSNNSIEDNSHVQKQIRKMFQNAERLITKVSSKLILGFRSPEGEEFYFNNPIRADAVIEKWLNSVDLEMKSTLKQLSKHAVFHYPKVNRLQWIKQELGMVSLVGSQIWWTWEVEDAFKRVKSGEKMAVKSLSTKLTTQLNELVTDVRTKLSNQERQKVTTMIILDVHARDIVDALVRDSILDNREFEWESQLRFYWDKSADDIKIRQCTGEFSYGYEYMGLNGRLVITPLTDRCFMTLTQALTFHLGGSPAGPAGTGKTESVKDLAKSLGTQCIVFNCGEGLDYKAMGRIFSGLCQNGAWGCFDEFNRIELPVLSVVSTQIRSIQSALKAHESRFRFEDSDINLDSKTGIFITMNPGYAGRVELPDNLKALFRPCTMVVPDLAIICEIMLFSEGFITSRVLARKMIKLYDLAKGQLSKQHHYDWGLRALKSILVVAGRLKRENPDKDEASLLMKALYDMNVAKFVAEDTPLFEDLLNDLFVSITVDRSSNVNLFNAIKTDLRKNDYYMFPDDRQVNKVIQLYDTLGTRHSVMVVGGTSGGKSVVINTLKNAQTKLGLPTKLFVLNPKAQTVNELYGVMDNDSREWIDGVLSNIFRRMNQPVEKGVVRRYVLFDGDVDAVWIENMNSVMDDNKVLTLPNGERIDLMTPQCSLLFEVGDLQYASPATVSRCGMVFVDPKNLPETSYMHRWRVQQFEDEMKSESVKRLFDHYVVRCIDYVLGGVNVDGTVGAPLKLILKRSRLNMASQLCTLLEAHLDEIKQMKDDKELECVFLFCLMWSIGACTVSEDRPKFDKFVKDITNCKVVDNSSNAETFIPAGSYPKAQTLYEYFYDVNRHQWLHWSSVVPEYEPPADGKYSSILVPTIDTERYTYLLKTVLKIERPVLFVGSAGTAKTVVIKNHLKKVVEENPSKSATLNINFSSRTTSLDVQRTIEDNIEKRIGDTYGPLSGKRLHVFIDDLSMPKIDIYGTQQPIALLKLLIERGGFYERGVIDKLDWKKVMSLDYITASSPPGGSNNAVDPRFLSLFSCFNLTFPSEDSLHMIFSSILMSHLSPFSESIRNCGEKLTTLTLEFYNHIVTQLPPTPSKFHYVFNLRDLSRMFEGICLITPDVMEEPQQLIRLWRNEAVRVFHDRLITNDDKEIVLTKLQTIIEENFKEESEFALTNPIVYGDFIDINEKEPMRLYQDMKDYACVKKVLDEQLNLYNDTMDKGMELVMFEDAIEHLCRIHRIIRMDRGHALLVGVGGSGKQSLTHLASFLANYEVFTPNLCRGYGDSHFREDLKLLFNKIGVENKSMVFLFTDAYVLDEGFLEYVNNILTTGMVPALFSDDEKDPLIQSVQKEVSEEGILATKENCWNYFVDKCRDNLHVVLAMSPAGESLRIRCRNFPGLVSNTSIDWFTPWPGQALRAVATGFLKDIDVPEEHRESLVQHMINVHLSVSKDSHRYETELRRFNYVTPKNYLDYIAMYKRMLISQRETIDKKVDKLSNGLDMLFKAKEEVETMRISLNETKEIVQKKTVQVNDLLAHISRNTSDAMANRKFAQKKDEELSVQTVKIEKEKKEAEEALAEAEPILQAAEDALRNLKKDDINTMKSYNNPQDFIKDVGKCLVILMTKNEATWKNAQAVMSRTTFIKELLHYDKSKLSSSKISAIRAIKKKNGKTFNPVDLVSKSGAAAGLLKWVEAIMEYFKIFKSVEPKRKALAQTERRYNESQAELSSIKAQLDALEKKISELNKDLAKRQKEASELKEKADTMERKLEKANKLIAGLGSERERWKNEIANLKEKRKRLVGDCLLGSGFLCYLGAFTIDFRESLLNDTWHKDLQERKIPVTEKFLVNEILTDDVEVAHWISEGLPADEVSIQNGILAVNAHKFPLCIDPQLQALEWIKYREGKELVVRSFNDSDFMTQLENAVKYGKPFLFENVDDFIDPIIESILEMDVVGRNRVIKLGDEEIDVDDNFKLFLCTRLSNPHYSPETFGKLQILNFCVTFDGLQEQLLNAVVNHERPELEEERKELVQETYKNKTMVAQLEDQILQELNLSGNTSLIENDDLIQTLDETKSKVGEIQVKLVKAAETTKEIEQARETYRSAAKRGAILFFAMTSLSSINNMYEYSLSSYLTDVFEFSLQKSEHSKMLAQRLENIVEYVTFRAYCYTCNGLFEEHKLTFSMLITIRILEKEGEMEQSELDFFLKGNMSLDKLLVEKPFDWISDQGWKDLFKLTEIVSACKDLVNDVCQNEKEWKEWYDLDDCENHPLPMGYDDKLSIFQKILLLKCFRVDRIMRAVTKFISLKMRGDKFVQPPVLDYQDIFNGSTNVSPIVCMISPGYDPAGDIIKLAEKLAKRYRSISLGQGQGDKALDMLKKGMQKGHWVVLQNCHLLVKWMKNVEKIVNDMRADKVHKEFRLWLTTEVTNEFSLAILQRALKVVTQPPNSLRLNMATTYSKVNDEQLDQCPHPAFKPLVFVLGYFHAVIQERRKYGKIGWNVTYDFNRSDFDICFSLLGTYLKKAYDFNDPVPWDSLKYLIGESMYGGRVTDDFDRRVLVTYLNEYMGDFLFDTFQPFHFFVDKTRNYRLPDHCLTEKLTIEDYRKHLDSTIMVDNTPEVFGLHSNAEIGYLTDTAKSLFINLIELQPRGAGESGTTSRETFISDVATEIQDKVPQPFDRLALIKKIGEKQSPIDVVLLQEVERWNKLVDVMRISLRDLKRALIGEIGMSAHLEELSFSLFNGIVPNLWRKYAPKTKKSLSNWLIHFQRRYEQYKGWIETCEDPVVMWLSGLHVPESYLTSIVQVTCKKYKWPLDRTTSIAKVTKFQTSKQIKQKPKDGCYVEGLFLEGAAWDVKSMELRKQDPKKLVTELPIVLITPIENSKLKLQNTFETPVYTTSDRASAAGPGLVFVAHLTTQQHSSIWTLNGVAMHLTGDE